MNDVCHSPRGRLLCAETLERRRLLSGSDPSDSKSEREIDPSDLPEAAQKAFEQRFPGAEIVEAEIAAESDNGARTYEISGELDGREVELTFDVTPAFAAAPASEPAPDLSLGTTPVAQADVATSDSAAISPASPSSTSTPVEVIEFESADEADDPEVAVAPGELPAHIRLALAKRFPGAELIEAEFSTGDEEEYGVSVKFNDQLIDVSLTPQGEITEVEQSVTSGDLPAEVLAWVREQFPDATIDEAAIVDENGEVSYEVEFTPAGQAPLEATLRVPGLEPPGQVPERPGSETLARGPVVPVESLDDGAVSDADDAAVTAPHDPSVESGAASGVAPSQPPNDVPAQFVAQSSEAPVGYVAPTSTEPASSLDNALHHTAIFAEALQSIAVAGPVGLLESLPDLAGASPVDVAAIEQRMQEMLAELEALAAKLAGDASDQSGVAMRIAVALAFFAGLQLLLLESRNARGAPTVVFNAAASSWSWVLGSVTRSRVRRRSSSSSSSSSSS